MRIIIPIPIQSAREKRMNFPYVKDMALPAHP